MRHRVNGVKLGRNTEQRKSLFKNLLQSLFTNGEIQTTEAKAKAIKAMADKLVAKASDNSVASRRVLARFFGTRQIVNRLTDEVAPAMKDRSSGYTRITRLGKRLGDDSMMVRMELVAKPAAKAVKSETKKSEVVKAEVKPNEVKEEVKEVAVKAKSPKTKKAAAK